MKKEEDPPYTLALGEIAIQTRLVRTLGSSWESLENKFHSLTVGDSSIGKARCLREFSKEAQEVLADVVHRQFPDLSELALMHATHLGGQTGPAWAATRIRQWICYFLRLDQTFDESHDPNPDSKVLSSVAKITIRNGWTEDQPLHKFRLPGWAASRRQIAAALRHFPSAEIRAEYYARIENERLSRAETLRLVRLLEFELWGRIEKELAKGFADAEIMYCKKGISPSEAFADQDAVRDAVADARRIVLVGFGSGIAENATPARAGVCASAEGSLPTKHVAEQASARQKGRPKSELVAMRQKMIRAVSATGVEGEDYCAKLDENQLSTPLEWQKRDGCPKKYRDAWNHPRDAKKWRQWIANEKSKATSRKSPYSL